jgi:enamine deaminase RidA (YjgF/YER057c/UK114 family)
MKGICILGILFIIVFTFACQNSSMQQEDVAGVSFDAEAKLKELGITLPQPPKPVANYVNAVRTGNLIFLAGKGPKRADGSEITGKLGREISIEEGYEAARLTAINQLAVLKAVLGDLNKVKRIVKVLDCKPREIQNVSQGTHMGKDIFLTLIVVKIFLPLSTYDYILTKIV